MPFIREPAPSHGTLLPMRPGIARIVAPNSGPMTYHGTNTWLIEDQHGLTLIDPGPAKPAHLDAILRACAGRLARVLVTHSHRDHVDLAKALCDATNAPSYGFKPEPGARFTPGHLLADGEAIAGFRAIHTPGHAADHLCYAYGDEILFSGDHVMGWASSIVSPPLGDMRAYLTSLRRLMGLPHTHYLCGHGPIITEPQAHVRSLLHHRIRRERAIAEALRKAPASTIDLMDRLYAKLDVTLRWAAERNVMAHLIKLAAEGRVTEKGAEWQWTDQARPTPGPRVTVMASGAP